MNRDFKGVWIPKEIWLNSELTLTEKIILVEIDSLDNEGHCTAGNEYLAEFCQCSERKVTDSIKKLVNLGYIEVVSFDGRCRTIKSLLRERTLNSMESSKKCEAASQNLLRINIDNNKENNTSKDVLLPEKSDYDSHSYSPADYVAPKKKRGRPKKKNLFDQCLDSINEFTDLPELREALIQYLKFRLEVKDKPLYGFNQWKAMLNKLDKCVEECMCEYVDIVQQSIDKGWLSFYPIKKSGGKSPEVFSEYGEVESVKTGDDDSGEYF